ncbi:hypothetical protein [Streptomyces sp. NPDC058206]|uniref:hypothetical protein n=1 Tax=Streptomyces sp. NPDC058206 TaxID=3346382 RepID=UPI0036E73766
MAGKTGRGQVSRSTGAAAPVVETDTVAVVAAEPGEAAALVAAEAGSAIAVICMRQGGKDERAALDRALSAATERGCRSLGAPRVVDATNGGATDALLAELRRLRPHRLSIADPDPTHVSFDEEEGRAVHSAPAERSAVALDALAAARAYQLDSSVPVFVDCRRGDADERLGTASGLRYPATTGWLTDGIDGRLSAFLPTAAGVVRWTQSLPGSDDWYGPELLVGPRLMPGLRVVRDPNGFVHLFGLGRIAHKGAGDTVDVVHAAQYQTGLPLTPWHSLEGPNPNSENKSREVGFPAAAFDSAGGLFVFVRNFGHSVSYREQGADGTWRPWRHLSGARVADDLAAVATAQGDVELYARARDSVGVVRWYRPGRDAAWTEDRAVPFAPRPGSMSAGPEPGTVIYRDLRTNEPCLWWPGARAPLPLGSPDGEGPVTGVRGVDVDGWAYSLLVRSARDDECVVGAYAEGRADAGVWWNGVGGRAVGSPAVVRDRTGMVTLAILSAGSRPAVTHRESPHSGFEFGSWHAV